MSSPSTPASKSALLLTALAAIAASTGCLEVSTGDFGPGYFGDGMQPLAISQGSLRGDMGPVSGLNHQTDEVYAADDGTGYHRAAQVWVRDRDRGTGMAIIDLWSALGREPAPGVVYHASNTGSTVAIDDNGDGYVRIDDETVVEETSDVGVVLCSGTDPDLQDTFEYDVMADEVVITVEEAERDPEMLDVRFDTITFDRDEEWEPLETYTRAGGSFRIAR